MEYVKKRFLLGQAFEGKKAKKPVIQRSHKVIVSVLIILSITIGINLSLLYQFIHILKAFY